MVTIGAPAAGATENPFKAGMRDLGWVEGRHIEYRTVYAHGDTHRLDALVRELLAQQVEVIVTSSAVSTRAAQRATQTLPIVMTFSVDAVGNALRAAHQSARGPGAGSGDPAVAAAARGRGGRVMSAGRRQGGGR